MVLFIKVSLIQIKIFQEVGFFIIQTDQFVFLDAGKIIVFMDLEYCIIKRVDSTKSPQIIKIFH